MAVTSGQVALNASTATQVVAPGNPNFDPSGGVGIRARSVTLFNPASQVTIYVGPLGVTASTGLAMPTGGVPVSLELAPEETLYAVSASATPSLHFLASGS